MRTTIGYVVGQLGQFSRMPFYSLQLSRPQGEALDGLLSQAGSQARSVTTLTATFHQPDRLRVTETEPPDYELRAAPQYVRGDVIRVQGKEGVSCGLDVSARFGVPLIREQLKLALAKARDFIELRVPSRKRDLIEFIPDVDLPSHMANNSDQDILSRASAAAAGLVLHAEDFSDWPKGK